jgi:thioredoxin reductase (NADPH)
MPCDRCDETPDLHGAYPRLSREQVETLLALGERRRVRCGEVLFREGDEQHAFIVVLSGRVAVVEQSIHGERLIAIHGERRFIGELGVLIGQPAFFTAVVRAPGELLTVPVERFRQLVTQDSELGEVVLRACVVARSLLMGLGTGLRIVGSRYSPDTRRLRELAARNRLPHVWIDPEDDRTAERLLQELGIPPEDTPVVIWRGRTVLRNPSNAELARLIGRRLPDRRKATFDLIVVGAGPAGLAAAVYGASEGLGTLVIDAVATGGQAGTTSKIENYLGFPAGVSGVELADRATIQAQKFGARITAPLEATGLEGRDGRHVVITDDGSSAAGRAVVIATGVHYRRLAVPRMEQLEPHSVYYAATIAEARICSGDPVVVVGGGNSAGQAALFLAGYARSVQLVAQENDLAENMSRYLAERIKRAPGIEVRLRSEVRELEGNDALQAVVVEDTVTGEIVKVDARALFVFIGADPQTQWLRDRLTLDAGRYILTGPAVVHGGRREPLLLETSRPGVFAVGDVRSGSIRRVASAIGDGAMAVRLVHRHLA